MADFCVQCSIEMFGVGSDQSAIQLDSKLIDQRHGDLSGLSTEEHTRQRLYCVALCEGCGFIQVDHTGRCVSPDCLFQHGNSAI